MLESLEVVAAELVGPLVVGAGDVAYLESHGVGMRPGCHLAEERAEWPGGGEEAVGSRFCCNVVGAGRQGK